MNNNYPYFSSNKQQNKRKHTKQNNSKINCLLAYGVRMKVCERRQLTIESLLHIGFVCVCLPLCISHMYDFLFYLLSSFATSLYLIHSLSFACSLAVPFSLTVSLDFCQCARCLKLSIFEVEPQVRTRKKQSKLLLL